MADEILATVRMLFARATELIEDAHEIAIEGQSPRLTADQFAVLGRGLEVALRDISVLAAAAVVLASAEDEPSDEIDDRESC